MPKFSRHVPPLLTVILSMLCSWSSIELHAQPVAVGNTKPLLLIDGDSVMANNPGSRSFMEYYVGDLAYKPEGYMLANGGQTGAEILANINDMVSKVVSGETICLVGPVGANQAPGSQTCEEISIQLDGIYSALLNAGAVVVAIPTLPDRSEYGNDVEKTALANFARSYPGIVVVDTTGFDPYLMKTDQSHPNSLYGAPYLGKQVRNAIRPLVTGSNLPTSQTSDNLLGAEWAFRGSVTVSVAGVTGTRPSGWTVSRTGNANWTLSKQIDTNGQEVLVCSTINSPNVSLLQIKRTVSYSGAQGNVYQFLCEVAVDPASDGFKGAGVVFEGTSPAVGAGENEYGIPEYPLYLCSSGTPLAAPKTQSLATISLGVNTGGSITYRVKRAKIYLCENVMGQLTITGTPPATGQVGSPYSFTPSVSGGTPPYAFSMSEGTLPPGLAVNPSTGQISGTPTTPGDYSGLVLRVTDNASGTAYLPTFQITILAAGAPVNIVLPSISGTTQAGQILSVSNGTWSNDPTSFTYQWLSSGHPISGATNDTYLLLQEDVGQTMSCLVTATNANGSSTVRTAETGVVEGGGSLPSGWTNQDIGAVGIAGSASYNGGVFTVSGSGADILNTTDAFQYVYQPISGDCTATVRVVTLNNTHASAKAGVMIRQDLTATSPFAMMCITPTPNIRWTYRTSAGAAAGASNYNTGVPYWLRVTRVGDVFKGYRSSDGITWSPVGTSKTITMGTTVYVGLPVCSHNNGTVTTATIDNVTIVGSSGAPPPPEASFSGNPTNGVEPLLVTFADTSTGTIMNRFWDFGDGTTTNVTTNVVAHSYAAGTNAVTLIVSGPDGSDTNSKPNYITVLTPFRSWQIQYFGNTSDPAAAPNADPDGDGLSNINEFLAGFNPTNNAAYLRIISIVQTNWDMQVSYLGANGNPPVTSRTNVLEFTTGAPEGSYANDFVSTGQTNILSGGTGLGVETNMVDTGGAAGPSRFYRVRVLMP